MARKKLTIEFDGLKEMSKMLENMNGDIKKATENALKKSHKIVTEKIETAMRPHKETGKTEESIKKDGEVEWNGTKASIKVGFDIENGGMASVFLMYGTKLYGKPHIAPDRKLYDSIYGTKTKKEIKEAQKEEFLKEIEKGL